MTIALTLQKYLDAKNVRYDLMRHEPTSSSMETAEVCHVSGDCIAKGVLLRDETGYALATAGVAPH